MKKGTKLYSILHSKCPRCQKGDLYPDVNPYHLKKMTAMYPECSNCKQSFDPEPGFYYGAMYVSYGLTVALAIFIIILTVFIFSLESFWVISIISSAIVILSPLTLRFSRNIWLNMFVKYNSHL
jgi:uncharacterized protein (DUF983 family)